MGVQGKKCNQALGPINMHVLDAHTTADRLICSNRSNVSAPSSGHNVDRGERDTSRQNSDVRHIMNQLKDQT